MILEYINKKYLADLTRYNHISKNKHYVGYSEYFNQKIFVKSYNAIDKYYNEINVLKDVRPNIILDNFIYNYYYIICFKYIDMKDVDKTTYSMYEYGKLIAKFHKSMFLENRYNSFKSIDLTKDIDRMMSKIVFRDKYKRIKNVYDLIKRRENQYSTEYNNLPKKIIHGDFGFRNIKVIGENLELIDFDFVKITIAYMDFIKFFHTENLKSSDINSFINGYNSIYPLNIPSELLIKVLEFHTAVGIYSYTMKIQDKDFESKADKIINNLEFFF